jgi:hypothetical protein
MLVASQRHVSQLWKDVPITTNYKYLYFALTVNRLAAEIRVAEMQQASEISPNVYNFLANLNIRIIISDNQVIL